MPLRSSFTRSALWDMAVLETVKEIGDPGETVFAIVAAKRISDKASYGLFCTDQALYLLRSEFACERVPWENVAIFAPSDYIYRGIQIVLGKTASSDRRNSDDIKSVTYVFQISLNSNIAAKEFVDFAMRKMSDFKIYSERIEILPGVSPLFSWRIFAGTIQLIQFTDINVENLSEEDKIKMNAALKSRRTELALKFAEIEKSFAFNQEGWRTRGEPEKEVNQEQLVAGANLPNVNLSDLDLSFKDLLNANFENADLSHCDLSFTYLANSNLKNANLSSCNLSGAILFKCNLEGANLSNSNLVWSTMDNSNLKNANLSGCDLRNTRLNGAVLLNANLTNSKMGYVAQDKAIRKGRKKTNFGLASSDNLQGTMLGGADLTSANLFGAEINFSNCYLKDQNGLSAVFQKTVMPDGSIHD